MTNIFSVVLSDPSFGDVIVMGHNKKSLDNEEWMQNYIEHVAKLYYGRVDPKVSNLVFAEGSGPNTKQRALGNTAVADGKPYKLNVAVVTDSFMVRGVVTALSWFNPLIKAYSPENTRAAALRCGIKPLHYPLLAEAMHTIAKEIGRVPILERSLAMIEEGQQQKAAS